ncbi:MAG: hypothetical protein KGL13_10340 [Gammaproteobacteria bacterium]|nr:hypothetical protein [Gammaproteobacteria bacterium]MDE2346851.1 hypothetical protein [Gammaproteobacteria bacterium]
MKFFITVLFGFSVFLVACGQQTSTTQTTTPTTTSTAPTPTPVVQWIDIQPNSHIKWTRGVIFGCPTGYHWIANSNSSAATIGVSFTCIPTSVTSAAMVDISTITDWQTPQPDSHIHWSNGSLMLCPSGTTANISTNGENLTCK